MPTHLLGNTLRRLEVVDSTNSLLKAEAELERAAEGAVVAAEHQTAGRGRLGRRWEAPPGRALLFSVLLCPDLPPDRLTLVSLLVSLGVLEGLEAYLRRTAESIHLSLKWPNDILFQGRKLCGVLCEAGVSPSGKTFVVAGVGLNVNQVPKDFSPDLRQRATSLRIATGVEHSRDAVLEAVLQGMEDAYLRLKREGSGWVAKAWTSRAGLVDVRATVTYGNTKVSGLCLGLEPEGYLRVRTDDGRLLTVSSGELEIDHCQPEGLI